MAGTTENLGFYFKEPLKDGADTFNIQTMLNDNWLILDAVLEGLSRDLPLATYIANKLESYIKASEKGAADGVATLGADGKVPSTQLPSMDYIPTSQKGAAGGVATLGSDGLIPPEQLGMRIVRTKYTGNGKYGTSVANQTSFMLSFEPKIVVIYDSLSIGYAVLVFPEDQATNLYTVGHWEMNNNTTASENTGIMPRISYRISGLSASSYFVYLYTHISDPTYQFNVSGREYTVIAIG